MKKCDCVCVAGQRSCRLKAWRAEINKKTYPATGHSMVGKIISDLEKICRKNINNGRTG